MSTITNPTKVITGPQTRWSYANVWNPKSINGGKPKYSVSLIIPKSDVRTVEKIKAAIKAAYEEGESKLKGNGKSVPPLSAIKTPLRDGDIERPDDETYRNAYFVNANSDTAPGIVDADRQPIIEHNGENYYVLLPVDDDSDELEYVILRETGEGEEKTLVGIDDEKTLDDVFKKYQKHSTDEN